ncbi:alpha-rhamnosidase [Fusarium phyllophilum]|uniref:alpha-L-rhamnosidase n=1 Tax=Fusarium phyllophilum TaxID=47803 RepID=A0A8H5J3I0_9HYPO|nr:alpha-rhamnosidase [Fusarium phyllophilum]
MNSTGLQSGSEDSEKGSKGNVADAYLVHVTSNFAKFHRLLNKLDVAGKYEAEVLRLRSLFQDRYITPAGNSMANTQTRITMAICFSLYRNSEKKSREVTAAAKALSRLPDVPRHDGRNDSLGTLDSMLPDGIINPGRMTNSNHYAFAVVAGWLHGAVGGIAPMASVPGWKAFRVKPIPAGNLTRAETSFEGPYGWIECKWTWLPGTGLFRMSLLVPPNSSALVTLPSELSDDPVQSYNDDEIEGSSVGSGLHTFKCYLQLRLVAESLFRQREPRVSLYGWGMATEVYPDAQRVLATRG